MPFKTLRLLVLLGLAVIGGAGSAGAHEPYLQVTANSDGTFTAEAGFSDASDVAGLPLVVRDRASGATLSEQALPTGGKLTLPIPAVPYRVTFDGGPGHKISKIGPERLAVAAKTAELKTVEPKGADAKSVESTAQTVESSSVKTVASERSAEPEFSRILIVVALVFLLAVVSFALGFFAAGRRTAAR